MAKVKGNKRAVENEEIEEFEIDDDDDFEVEEIIGEVEDSDEDVEDEDEEDDEINTVDMQFLIDEAVNNAVKSSNKKMRKYVSLEVGKLRERITDVEERVEKIEEIVGVANSEAKKSRVEMKADEPKAPNVLDVALGTVGNILHGVVDTVAFVAESTIDIATLGRAKQQRTNQ